ncbi:MAG: hypothetical protein WC900_03285 [Oscillospiraceae bacterium]
MKNFLLNKWTRLGASLLSIIYVVIIILLAYNTFIYQLVIKRAVAFGIVYIIFNLIFLTLMFYSRKEIATSIFAMVLLPFVFFILIFNFGNWLVIAPPFIVAIVAFFMCKAPEVLKTLLGTIYLLMYILGIIAYLVVRLLLSGSAELTVLGDSLPDNNILWDIYSRDKIAELMENSVSPDGAYRYYIVDVKDSPKGRVELYVEPNNLDKKYKYFDFLEKGCFRKIAVNNTRGTSGLPQLQWVDGDTIQYKFSGDSVKTNDIAELVKDYFSFLYS